MRTEVGKYDYIVHLDGWDTNNIGWILNGCKDIGYYGDNEISRENNSKSIKRLERLGMIENGKDQAWQFTKAGQVMALTLDGQGLL